MRRFALFALALALGAPACDDDNPIGPSNSGTHRVHRRTEGLERESANQQRRVEWAGNRHDYVQRPARRVSGNVTDEGAWNVQAVVSGLTNDSFIRVAHIHNGPVGVNAGVFVDTCLTPANQIPLPGGAGTINFEGVQITQAQAQAVLNNPAGHYFNMHSPLNPGGVVRGQLVRVR